MRSLAENACLFRLDSLKKLMFKMGSSESKVEDVQEVDSSNGFHVIEIHGQSTATSVLTVLIVMAIIVLSFYACRRCEQRWYGAFTGRHRTPRIPAIPMRMYQSDRRERPLDRAFENGRFEDITEGQQGQEQVDQTQFRAQLREVAAI